MLRSFTGDRVSDARWRVRSRYLRVGRAMTDKKSVEKYCDARAKCPQHCIECYVSRNDTRAASECRWLTGTNWQVFNKYRVLCTALQKPKGIQRVYTYFREGYQSRIWKKLLLYLQSRAVLGLLHISANSFMEQKKLSYRRETVRRATLVNSCYVSRGMGVQSINLFICDKGP